MVIKDGAKMSKSKGNVVDPEDIINRYGADTMRVFILFSAPPEKDLDWREEGVEGSWRFLNRVYRIVDQYTDRIKDIKVDSIKYSHLKGEVKKLYSFTHRTVKRVTEDIEKDFHFNTAISAIMELLNEISSLKVSEDKESLSVIKFSLERMALLLSPFAPHLSEELWSMLGNSPSIFERQWPTFDEEALKEEEIQIVIQINGKVRDRISIPADSDEDFVKEKALKTQKIAPKIQGRSIKKIIYVPQRLINIVI
jgi:leucyl-tRNA synthetase